MKAVAQRQRPSYIVSERNVMDQAMFDKVDVK
jgi:hypothetical protein